MIKSGQEQNEIVMEKVLVKWAPVLPQRSADV